jgi:hypothetical protein
MKSPGWPAALIVSCVLFASVRSSASEGDGRDEPSAPALEQGLSKEDRAIFFHKAEGSELVPLAWAKAMTSIRTSRPFLELPERFGFIPDPEDAAGLPIGLTAAPSRGAEVLGPMVGVNCAACHVSFVTYKNNPPYRLLGAPNMFDLNAFYQELFLSLAAAVVDDEAQLEFMEAVANQGDLEFAILTQQLLTSVAVASKLSDAQAKDSGRLFQLRLLQIVQTLAAETMAKAKAAGKPPDAAALQQFKDALAKEIAGLIKKDVLGLVALTLSDVAPDESLIAASRGNDLIGGSIQQFLVQLSLFRARIRLFKDLSALQEGQHPIPGPGRIDAFNGIRDLVFPRPDSLAADSPVSYPALWMVNQTYWLHWDGNTNSVIERNVGQALGQGAAFQKPAQKTYHSTVQPENIHALEMTIRKMSPPEWPAGMFGPIDGAKAARGNALYQKHCVACHVVAPRTGRDVYDVLLKAQAWSLLPADRRGPPPAVPAPLEKLIPMDQVGTDPARAVNFATNVGRQPPQLTGGTDFAVAVGDAAWNYSNQSYNDLLIPPSQRATFDWPREMVRWQTTRCYVARPLVSVWATAPYLHNGSVPTLYDLLLPAKARPKLFPVGHREYDPVKLGHAVALEAIPPAQYPLLFEINTTMSGNSNAGHEYGTNLSDAERYDLLEYLKAL